MMRDNIFRDNLVPISEVLCWVAPPTLKPHWFTIAFLIQFQIKCDCL